MNPLVKIVLGAGAVIAIAVLAMNYHSTVKTEYEYRAAKEAIRVEYHERAAAVRSTPEPAAYEEEIRGLLKWYFSALTDVYNRFPAFKGADEAYLRNLDEQKANARVKGEEYDSKKANFQQVKEFYDLMKGGKYQPAMTAIDHSIRIDFLEFEPAMVDGQRGVKGRFVLWGAQRRRMEEKGPAGTTIKSVQVPLTWGDMQLVMTSLPPDPKDKEAVAKAKKNATPFKAEASFGLPSGPYVPYPERQIEDFPPMAFLGTFAFPLLPYEAQKADMELGVTSRTGSGHEIVANFKWSREIPAEWRLKEGEKWEGAQEEEREELAEQPKGK
jgi:hypothetical protein